MELRPLGIWLQLLLKNKKVQITFTYYLHFFIFLVLLILTSIPIKVDIISIINTCPNGGADGTLCITPRSQTQKRPENTFHKRVFRSFSQSIPTTCQQRNDYHELLLISCNSSFDNPIGNFPTSRQSG